MFGIKEINKIKEKCVLFYGTYIFYTLIFFKNLIFLFSLFISLNQKHAKGVQNQMFSELKKKYYIRNKGECK